MSNSKVILITGSSSGIGRATAFFFASKGFRIAVHGSSSQEKVDKVVEQCNKLAPSSEHKSFGFVANFNDPKSTETLIPSIIKHFGRLDTLVCNAGIDANKEISSPEYCDELKRHQTIIADAHIRVMLAAIPYLQKAENASITVMLSVTDQPIIGSSTYMMTYASMRAFVRSLAVDLAPTIRVSSITLGPIFTQSCADFGMNKTDYIDYFLAHRYGEPEEVAQNIWHLSQEATYATGSDFKVDGGLSISEYEHGM